MTTAFLSKILSNKKEPSLEFLNSHSLIKKFCSLRRRDIFNKLDCFVANAPRNDELPATNNGNTLLPYSLISLFPNKNVKNLTSYRLNDLKSSKKAAFTLAEVLITLGVIGVVAAMTMPALVTNIQQRVREKRVENIKQKYSKATDHMLATVGLSGYDSTAAFVAELQKHLKIAKVCDNNNLSGCWPTEKVTLGNGEEWEIAKTKTGKALKMPDNDAVNEWDDTMAFVTADGTPYIISYNKKCDQDVNTPVLWSSSQSSSTNCTSMIFDWNGGRKPNTFGGKIFSSKSKNDVVAFNANGLGSACAIEIDGLCFGVPFQPTCLTQAQSDELRQAGMIDYTSDFDTDCWGGAVKQCGGKNKMPDLDQLDKLYQIMISNDWSETTATLNLPTSFHIWSGIERSIYTAYGRSFSQSSARTNYNGRYVSGIRAVCLE